MGESGIENGHSPALNSSRVKPAALGAIILISGILIGVAGTFIVRWSFMRGPFPPGPPTPTQVVTRMVEELRLANGPAEEFKKVATPRIVTIHQIMSEKSPRIDEQFELMKKEVSGVLDEAKYKEWLERIEWAQKSFRDSPQGPPGPGRHPYPPPFPPSDH